MARNAQIAAAVLNNTAGRPCALHITFAHGKELTVKASDLTNEVMEYAIFHGLKQKLVDAAAIGRNPETGRSATITDKYEAVKAVYDRLIAGRWNAERGEGGAPAGGLLFAALVRMYAGKKSDEAIREFLAGKDDKQKAALRKNPRVAEIIEQIKAERASADEGEEPGADLLEELDSDGGED
jgi:hypothetical protein